MSKKSNQPRRIPALLLAVVFLSLPFSPAHAGNLLGYEEPQSHSKTTAVLHFRYEDSRYLEQETRELSLAATESLEKALVQALLDGPSPAFASLHSLFPQGTQVLNVLSEGSRLFVTFSGEIMNALPGENTTSEQGRANALLRRTLAMASLVNTLTERGEHSSVQVLVVDQTGLSNSLRLSQRYYLMEDDSLPPPLTRMEDAIITPGRAAEHMLNLWKNQNTKLFIPHLTSKAEDNLAPGHILDASTLPLLRSFSISQGSTAPDGSYAMVVLEALLTKQNGQEAGVYDFPLKLNRSQGVWTLSLPSFLRLLEAASL